MSVKNILYMANSGRIVGGGEVSLLGLLEWLDSARYKPFVVCPYEGEMADEARNLGVEVSIVEMRTLRAFNPFFLFSSINRLMRIIREKNIAVVHANGSRCAVYAGFACLFTRTPVIWHVRILESDGILDRLLAALVDVIIVNSLAVKARFKWLSDQNRIETVYNGINLDKFQKASDVPATRRSLGVKPGVPLIGTVGRLDWYKAHQYFIRAAAYIKELVPGARFVIVGEGEEHKALELQVIKYGLQNEFIFAGYRRDIPELLQAFDVFVLPSVSEGFGRVAVEAMAAGKPVVVTKIGGLAEIVEDGINGRFVPAGNPLAIADRVVKILRSRDLAASLSAGARIRAEAFGIKKNVENIMACYQKLTG